MTSQLNSPLQPLSLLLGMILVSNMEAKVIEVHGHRGARAIYPENTLPAFDYALSVGVDVLELDMGITKDKRIVVSHERHISPEICLDGAGKPIPHTQHTLIHALTLEDVKKFDCGSIQNAKFPKQSPIPGTRIPTLAEVFELVQNSKYPAAKTVRFNIETKIDPEFPADTVGPDEFVELVIAELHKYGMEKRVILQSFDPRTLKIAKTNLPELPLAYLTDKFFEIYNHKLEEIGAGILSPHFKLMYFPGSVARAQKAGYQVIPWTVNDPKDWDKLIALNVDAIISDDPGALLEHLRAKGLHP